MWDAFKRMWMTSRREGQASDLWVVLGAVIVGAVGYTLVAWPSMYVNFLEAWLTAIATSPDEWR
jgi:prolipoprotein diacylglyceryltransferase